MLGTSKSRSDKVIINKQWQSWRLIRKTASTKWSWNVHEKKSHTALKLILYYKDIWSEKESNPWHTGPGMTQVGTRAVKEASPSCSPAGRIKNLTQHQHQTRAFCDCDELSHNKPLHNFVQAQMKTKSLHKPQNTKHPPFLSNMSDRCFFTHYNFSHHLVCPPYR